ncbi:hypothetical protein EVA_02818 [gut metagenome]|uniref:Uncharacterized protein n=1 Tax=gut metagenome TaxID=749906 RepID=J9H0E0_9ZZZZ
MQVSVADGGHIPCPKCRAGRILLYPKVAKCSNVDCPDRLPQQRGEAAHRQPDCRPCNQRQNIPYQRIQEQGRQALRCVPHLRQGLPHRVRVPAPHGQAQRKGAQAMNGIGWITVAEAARLCGTDELRITLWMNGNHIAYARFDGILMIDGASLAALFSRNRVATIYEDVAQQRGKPGRPGRLRRLLDTPSTPSACRSASSGRAGSWASSPWSTCSSTSAASASPACTVSATSAADRQPRPSGGSGRTA